MIFGFIYFCLGPLCVMDSSIEGLNSPSWILFGYCLLACGAANISWGRVLTIGCLIAF